MEQRRYRDLLLKRRNYIVNLNNLFYSHFLQEKPTDLNYLDSDQVLRYYNRFTELDDEILDMEQKYGFSSLNIDFALSEMPFSYGRIQSAQYWRQRFDLEDNEDIY